MPSISFSFSYTKSLFLLLALLIVGKLSAQQQWRKTKDGGCTYFTSLSANFSWSGECKEGKLHGEGVLQLFNEQDQSMGRFEGKMLAGVLQGQAIRYYANGQKFVEGNFKDGMLDGKGTIWYSDGQIFSGQFQAGNRMGLGTLTQANGNKYVGTWQGAKMEGPGKVLIGPEEHLFVEGTYTNNQLEGKAKIRWKSGVAYTGSMKNSLRHGQGEMRLPAGHTYTGSWEAGLMHGPGKLTFSNGYVLEGNWEKGSLARLPITIFPIENTGPIDMTNLFPGQEILLHMIRDANLEPGKKTEEIQFKNYGHLSGMEVQVEARKFRDQKFSLDARRWKFMELTAIVYKVDTARLDAQGKEVLVEVEPDALVRDSTYMYLSTKNLGYFLNGISDVIIGTEKPIGIKERNKRQGLFMFEMRRNWERFTILPVNSDPYEISYTAKKYFHRPLLSHGTLYDGFRFNAPEKGGDLFFSFYCEDLKSVSWYILPKKGKMNGFRLVEKREPHTSMSPYFQEEKYIIQKIPAREFIPGQEYLIHFSFGNVRPRTIDVSLNMFPDSALAPRDLFSNHPRAYSYYRKAKQDFEQKDFDQALDYLGKAIELEADNFRYHSLMGQVYFGKEAYKQAIDAFQLALDQGDQVFDNKFKKGVAHFQLGEYQQAIPLLEKVVYHISDHSYANYTLALCHINLKQAEKSCPYLKKAQESGIIDTENMIQRYCQ